MASKIPLLDIGQDLSNLSDSFKESSINCANLNAELEDLEMFGKTNSTMQYININIDELTKFSNKLDDVLANLQVMKLKINSVVKDTVSYIENFSNHVF